MKTFLIAYSAYTKTKFLQKKLRNQHQDDKTYNFLFPYRDWGVYVSRIQEIENLTLGHL